MTARPHTQISKSFATCNCSLWRDGDAVVAAPRPMQLLGQRAKRGRRRRSTMGVRVLVRNERTHSGIQLLSSAIKGHRFTCSATDDRQACKKRSCGAHVRPLGVPDSYVPWVQARAASSLRLGIEAG